VILVPRDVINIKLGDIILANVHLLEEDPLKISLWKALWKEGVHGLGSFTFGLAVQKFLNIE